MFAKGVDVRFDAGEEKGSGGANEGLNSRTVRRSSSSSSSSSSIGVVTLLSLEGDWSGVCALVGEVKGVVGLLVDVGVVGRALDPGEEGEGDCGRRKGEVRGDP